MFFLPRIRITLLLYILAPLPTFNWIHDESQSTLNKSLNSHSLMISWFLYWFQSYGWKWKLCLVFPLWKLTPEFQYWIYSVLIALIFLAWYSSWGWSFRMTNFSCEPMSSFYLFSASQSSSYCPLTIFGVESFILMLSSVRSVFLSYAFLILQIIQFHQCICGSCQATSRLTF